MPMGLSSINLKKRPKVDWGNKIDNIKEKIERNKGF